MLSLPLLLFILAAGGLVAFWQNSLGARERANHAAQDACERMQLQFLDGTVAFASLSLARDAGRLTLRRTYVFDYTSASIDRRQGFVTMLGQRIESVGFAPAAQPEAATRLNSETDTSATPPSADSTGKVINLEDFRQRRGTGHPSTGNPGTSQHSSTPNNDHSTDQGW